MTALSKRDRYRGAMVGLLAGDAIGAPYETWTAEAIAEDLAKRGGLTMFDYVNPWAAKEGKTRVFPRGRPTDDADHGAGFGQSLVALRRVDQEDIFKRLRHITFDHVSPLWSGRAYGAGRTTRLMLRPATWAESQAITEETYPSNGALMRIAALALLFGSFDKFSIADVEAAVTVTHRHELVVDCCAAFVATLCNLLEGHDAEYSIKSHIGFSLSDHVSMHYAASEPKDPGQFPERGAVTLTLHIAYWCLHHAKSFEDGIERAIRIGGDTDTYAAVAGALLGAKFGHQAIPHKWRRELLGREIMKQIADDLYDIAHPSSSQAA